MEVLNAAKPYPVRGLYRLSEYPEIEIETFVTGFDGWSNAMRLFPGEFMVITGVPGHGKSTWVLNLLTNLTSIHGWRIALCSPEMPTVPILRDRFRKLVLGRRPEGYEKAEIARADAWIEDRFVFIDTDPTGIGDADEPFDLDWVIDRATDAVLRDGIRVLVIDPWNEIEHARGKNETVSDYIARGIRALKRFGRLYDVTVMVIAHPTKDIAKDGKLRTVTLYDIDGSAAWFNKADHGIVVERAKESDTATIHIQKVRWDETGRRGAKMPMRFERETGQFFSMEDVA
jgi:twinkle protein